QSHQLMGCQYFARIGQLRASDQCSRSPSPPGEHENRILELGIVGRTLRMVRFSQLSILALLFTFATGTSIYAESAFDVGRELQRRGDYSAAEQSYRTFLHQEPRSVPALTNLGVVLAHQGRFHEAIGTYRKALSIAPE